MSVLGKCAAALREGGKPMSLGGLGARVLVGATAAYAMLVALLAMGPAQ